MPPSVWRFMGRVLGFPRCKGSCAGTPTRSRSKARRERRFRIITKLGGDPENFSHAESVFARARDLNSDLAGSESVGRPGKP